MKNNNKVRLQSILKTVFPSVEGEFKEEWGPNEIEEWDSIGHMTLVAALEENYKISLETDDIVDFSSFKKGIEILKKYSINFN